MSYELLWEPQGVYRRFHGDVSAHERRRSFEEICNCEHFDQLRYSITNYLDVAGYEEDRRATEELAALHIGPVCTNPNIVIAAVAVRPDIVESINYFIKLNFIDRPYVIFDELHQARAWVSATTRSQAMQPRRCPGFATQPGSDGWLKLS